MKAKASDSNGLSFALTTGRSFHLKGGDDAEFQDVPPMFQREVVASEAIIEGVEPKQKDDTGLDRNAVIGKAITEMIADDSANDNFNSNGSVNLKTLAKKVGFTVDRDTADKVFAEVTEE